MLRLHQLDRRLRPGSNPDARRHDARPEDPYGIAKYAVELDLHAAKNMFDLNSIVFRPHNVFGERQNIGDRYRNVIGIFMNQIMSGQPMTFFGDGSQTRAFSYIADVAPLIANSIQNPAAQNRTFNVGADAPISLSELAKLVAEAMNAPAQIKHLAPRKEVLHAVADHSQLIQVFQYQPRWNIHDGLKRMADWAKKIGPRKPSTFSNIELRQNLPEGWET